MSTFHRVLSTFRNIALILTVSGLVHAQVPISGLPQATLPLTGNESVVMNQNGTTKQGKVSSITSLVTLSQATGITLTPNPIVGGAGTIGLTIPVAVTSGGTGALTLSGLVVGNGTGPFTGYAGATCTNQFLRSLSATGSGTCNSVNLALDVTGNLSVNNLNSGTGASSTTYWSGNGTWSTPPGTLTLANPTGTIGLTAVNGVATTALRSDSAPPLSQAISPTWTGTHGFNGTYVTSSATSLTSPGQNGITFVNSGSGANAKIWDILQTTANHLTFRAVNDAFGSAGSWLDVTRSGLAISSLNFGNSADQPTYQFNSVPTFTVNGTTNSWSWGGSTAGAAFPVLARYNAGSGGTDTIFYHSRGASIGTNTILQSGDELGSISFDGSDGTATPVRGARIIGFADGVWTAASSTPGRLEFYTVPSGSTSIVQRLILNGNGQWTFQAPSVGGQTAFTFNGRTANNAMLITQQAGAGNAFGLVVQAGTNSSDYALNIQSQAGAQYFEIFGDGGITTGANTDQGSGTINATQYYRAGLPMFPVIGVGSCNAGGCTALRATGMSTTITRAGPGQYTVTFTNSFAGQNVCFVTVQGTTAAYGVANPVAGSTTVNTFNSAGTLTDTIWGLTCT